MNYLRRDINVPSIPKELNFCTNPRELYSSKMCHYAVTIKTFPQQTSGLILELCFSGSFATSEHMCVSSTLGLIGRYMSQTLCTLTSILVK